MQYYTVIIDISKFRRWLAARRANGARITASKFAEAAGYGKSYISQLLSGKYSIEVSGRFIGTVLETFKLDFNEIFRIIPCEKDEDLDKYSGVYVRQKVFKRFSENKPYACFYSH